MSGSTTATTQMLLKVFANTPPLPPWDDAEQCCLDGDLDHPEPGWKCWCVGGRAEFVWSSIQNEVLDCATDCQRKFAKRKPYLQGYSVGCYMAGLEKVTSRPYVFIASTSSRFRRKLQTAIEKAAWWSQFRQENSAFGGILHANRQPALYTAGAYHNDYFSAFVPNDTRSLFGAPVFLQSQDGANVTQGVLGGPLLINTTLYGLTASHILPGFSDGCTTEIGDVTMLSDDEDYMSDSTDSEEMSDPWFTTPPPLHNVTASDLKRHDGAYSKIGFIDAKSLHGQDRYSDWALVKIQKSSDLETEQLVENKRQDTYPDRFAKIGKLSACGGIHVFVVLSGKILAAGNLSSTPSIVCLPGYPAPALLYSIVTDATLNVGHCGMWVLDSNGNWYGHVIAGEPGTNIVYISEASEIIDQVRQQYGYAAIRVFMPTFRNWLRDEPISPLSDITFKTRKADKVISPDHLSNTKHFSDNTAVVADIFKPTSVAQSTASKDSAIEVDKSEGVEEALEQVLVSALAALRNQDAPGNDLKKISTYLNEAQELCKELQNSKLDWHTLADIPEAQELKMGLAGDKRSSPSLIDILRSRPKPKFFLHQKPGLTSLTHRWVCSICQSGFRPIRRRSPDLKTHLRQFHGFSAAEIAEVFSDSGEALYQHFGPFSESDAMRNGLPVGNYSKRPPQATTLLPPPKATTVDPATIMHKTENVQKVEDSNLNRQFVPREDLGVFDFSFTDIPSIEQTEPTIVAQDVEIPPELRMFAEPDEAKWEYQAYTQANPPDSLIPARIEIERLEREVSRQRAYLAAQEEIGRRPGLNTTVYSTSGSPGEYWGQPTTIGLGSKEIGDVKANMVFDFPLSRYFLHSERTQKPSEELENEQHDDTAKDEV